MTGEAITPENICGASLYNEDGQRVAHHSQTRSKRSPWSSSHKLQLALEQCRMNCASQLISGYFQLTLRVQTHAIQGSTPRWNTCMQRADYSYKLIFLLQKQF